MAKEKKNPQDDLRRMSDAIAAGTFKNVTLFFGEEDYLRNQYKDKMTDALTGGEKSMNFDKLTGKDVSAEQVIDLAETMPFFSERRVILLEDTGWLKNGCDAMVDYISQGVCESTFILFCEKEVDKRSKLYKAISAAGDVAEFMTQDERTLVSWTMQKVREAGLKIDSRDADYLIGVAGTDMVNLSHEIQKLTSYCLGRENVTAKDIDEICSRRLEDRVFEMCEALAHKKQREALRMYYDLMEMRESPIKVLVLVTRQYNILLQVKDLERKNKNDRDIAAKIGKPDWTIRNYRSQTSHYTYEQLKNIVINCAETDYKIKTGMLSDSNAVEMLMINLSGEY